MVHLKSWLVSPAPCQGPIWRWENTWWSTRLLTRPRTRRSASSPSLSSSSSKSTPEESMFSNTIARTFVWFIDYLSTRWVLCRVGNTGRQIRLLVPKVIFSSNFNFFFKFISKLFCSRFLQAADLSTSALAHREVWPKHLLGMSLRLKMAQDFCLQRNPMVSPGTKKPWVWLSVQCTWLHFAEASIFYFYIASFIR